jgi:dihydrofolate reductase
MATESPRAELMVDFIISLDGFAAADDWPGLWGLGGPEYFDWLGQQSSSDYEVLMGTTTYQLMSGFAAEADDDSFADLDARSKVVFSSTLEPQLSWANSRLVDGDAVEAVRSMKESETAMRTVGSVSLCRSLLRAGLVDRLRLVVFPVITGATGRERIYDGYPDVSLTLLDSRTFDGRLQLLEYAPTVLTEPPGADAPMTSPV